MRPLWFVSIFAQTPTVKSSWIVHASIRKRERDHKLWQTRSIITHSRPIIHFPFTKVQQLTSHIQYHNPIFKSFLIVKFCVLWGLAEQKLAKVQSVTAMRMMSTYWAVNLDFWNSRNALISNRICHLLKRTYSHKVQGFEIWCGSNNFAKMSNLKIHTQTRILMCSSSKKGIKYCATYFKLQWVLVALQIREKTIKNINYGFAFLSVISTANSNIPWCIFYHFFWKMKSNKFIYNKKFIQSTIWTCFIKCTLDLQLFFTAIHSICFHVPKNWKRKTLKFVLLEWNLIQCL